ncbi:MAG TPA: hypothetical protein VM716_10915 [Gemmatimonadales bacterium]|nr:hypothetical protein [Gemmatimonadales bacterium]
MNAAEKAVLTTAFETLGPERVMRGLKARGHSWSDCFLALVIAGEPGAASLDLQKRWRKEHSVSMMLRLPVRTVTQIVSMWDHDETSFRSLAVEWLELNRVATAPHAPASA